MMCTAAPSSRPSPHGSVWRFYMSGYDGPASRTWTRLWLSVAAFDYYQARESAERRASALGLVRPLLIGVQRQRAASPGREPAPVVDARFGD